MPASACDEFVKTIKIRCEYNCGWEGLASDKYFKHLKEYCENAKVECGNPGCNHVCSRPTMLWHMDTCSFKKNECSKCFEIFYGNKEKHMCKEPKVLCQECKIYVDKALLKRHQYEECFEKPSYCIFSGMGCSFKGGSKSMTAHLNDKVKEHLELSVMKVKELERTIEKLIFTKPKSLASCEKEMYSIRDNKIMMHASSFQFVVIPLYQSVEEKVWNWRIIFGKGVNQFALGLGIRKVVQEASYRFVLESENVMANGVVAWLSRGSVVSCLEEENKMRMDFVEMNRKEKSFTVEVENRGILRMSAEGREIELKLNWLVTQDFVPVVMMKNKGDECLFEYI